MTAARRDLEAAAGFLAPVFQVQRIALLQNAGRQKDGLDWEEADFRSVLREQISELIRVDLAARSG